MILPFPGPGQRLCGSCRRVLKGAAAVTVLGLLTMSACGGRTLSWELTESWRIDSIDVFLRNDRILMIRICCDTGIGSAVIGFEEPVTPDSLELTLMYTGDEPYRICESLDMDLSGFGEGLPCIWNVSGQELDEDGTVRFSISGSINEVGIGWIDYYRN